MPFEAKQQILVIQTAFIGDVFLMVPMLKELRALYPRDLLILVVREGLAEFLKKMNLADEVFEVKKGSKNSYAYIQNQLKARYFRWLISPHSSMRTALFTLPLKAKKKISYRHWWNWFFFDLRILKNSLWPEPLRQLQLLEPIWQQDLMTHFDLVNHSIYGVNTDYRKTIDIPVDKLKMNLSDRYWLPYKELQNQFLLKYHLQEKKFVVIFPGSVWQTKQWTIEGYSELAVKLSNQNYDIVFMGSKAEIEICNTVGANVKKVINLAGQLTLWESLVLLSAAQLVIGNDSGSMHMAAFVDVPNVAIFGPTVLAQGFRPWQNRATVIENEQLSCRPCGKHGHKTCPLKHHKCMKSISSDLVFLACKRYI